MTDAIRESVLKRLEEGKFNCPKELTLSMFSGKWKLVILYHLNVDGPYRFNELMRFLSPITHKVLTNQLRELEEDGLVTRIVYSEKIVKVIYKITPLGQSLFPIIDSMFSWGKERIKQIDKEHCNTKFKLDC
ncbi:TPA: helix-turn-helix transcriptional regulator [Enterococcus faecalis]|uniref:winged helix-turn-helix transcriptional regulator n=1 Tax=Enterococcus faecalis TaxID=1351 RepID=UPI000CF5E6C2|nr:helix-turn-helix domain-containing protein [Enterococcus faecalis]PQC14609.1 transcriptional regulator [Enterococcus faecalis]HAP3815346.1 helix-turn-helix transcriptional regulator [Enterococcus faecalis]